jgi:hypothetical protein
MGFLFQSVITVYSKVKITSNVSEVHRDVKIRLTAFSVVKSCVQNIGNHLRPHDITTQTIGIDISKLTERYLK